MSGLDNGRAAVEAALEASPPFDGILMDCDMPIMDGWGATREIRQAAGNPSTGTPRTPIIALTANAMVGRCIQPHGAQGESLVPPHTR